MKFGLLFRPQDPPNAENLVGRWQEILEAAVLAEECGFDGLFLPEHHMVADGYLPSPWAALGALAAKTSRVEIGTSIHLLPLQHPIQVAEAAAMVDILSNGRFRMGVALGHFDPEFELFGVDPKTQVSRFEESLDLVRRAWDGEVFDHEGKHFKIKGGPVTPAPISAEIWMGATSEPGVKRAARLGLPWLTDDLHNIRVIERWADIYREAAQEHGTPEKARVCMLREGWVADSLEEVERVWWPKVRQDNWFYFKQIPRYVADLEPWVATVESEDDFVFEQHNIDRMIVGPPEECITRIRKFEEVIDPEYMIMTFRVAEGPSFEEELECIRRFGSEVIPAFKQAPAAQA